MTFPWIGKWTDKSARNTCKRDRPGPEEAPSKLYLATDPDREGEAISWHVRELLERDNKALTNVDVKRVVFNEITKERHRSPPSTNPRELDTPN